MTKKSTKEEAIEIAEEFTEPDACQGLTPKMREFAEHFFVTLCVTKAANLAGYTRNYAYKLKKDRRIIAYLNHLRQIADAQNVLAKGQMIQKLGQRFLDKSVDTKDLTRLSKELRILQGYGTDQQFNQQINIKLPDTYNQFLQNGNEPKKSEIDTDEWQEND